MANTCFKHSEHEYIKAGVFKCVSTVLEFDKLFSDNPSDEKFISSSIHFTGNNRTIGWSLNLSFQSRNDDTDDPDNMILKINRLVIYHTPYIVGSNKALYVVNNEGEEIKLVDRFTEGAETWNEYRFSRKSLMLNRKVFLPGNKLKLVCHVYVYLSIPSSKQIKISKQNKFSYFANFVENDEFSDVTIIVNKQEFRAHKIFLSARSPVFAAMFRHEMKEKCENRIVIDDIDCETLKAMLQYIYTNEVTNIDDIVMDLLVAADKYELNDLKELCEKTLSEYVTIATVKRLLFIADRYNAELLLDYIVHFLEIINPPVVKNMGLSVIFTLNNSNSFI